MKLIHKRVITTDKFGAQLIRSACGATGRLADVWPLVTCDQCQQYRWKIE